MARDQILILIVEKDPFMREVERRLLEKSYQLEFVGDGVRALSRACELLPDLIVSEILVPKLDGLGVTRRLRACPATHSIPILVFSLLAAEVRALAAGASVFLRKPIRKEQFIAVVEDLVSQSKRQRQRPMGDEGD
ncbi:MAG: response regulator [Chloroflexi bacterium]|nr:response regulator [Chloroflexota bacterium]